MNFDFLSVLFGVFLAYFMDVLFSVCNYFIQKALFIKEQRKVLNKDERHT